MSLISDSSRNVAGMLTWDHAGLLDFGDHAPASGVGWHSPFD
jgi:hypothetical protein